MRNRISSFAPVANSTARILILGSMPGEASLNAGQYYAHPRNAFWRIMHELIGFDTNSKYEQRLNALKSAGIALWDVLHSCHREGSLDTAIESESIQINHFDAFFDHHAQIELVCFNGGTAERFYKQYVLPTCQHSAISYFRLPSTSPAHAALSFEEKVKRWRAAIGETLTIKGK